MGRDDRDAEAIRRGNAVARSRVERVVLTGLAPDAVAAVEGLLTESVARRLVFADDLAAMTAGAPTLDWGADRIGEGLLLALRTNRLLRPGCGPSPQTPARLAANHLVICEAGEPLSEVIAALYAFALDADLVTVPAVGRDEADAILDAYYDLNDPGDRAPTRRLADLSDRLRSLCGAATAPPGGAITVISKLPLGLAFPAVPSTHLLPYPDLGIAIINGFAAEQPGTRGINVAVLVDPGTTAADEISAAAELLPKRHVFVRRYSGPGADVRRVTEMVENFPYDLLVFATHCGDADGQRCTYRYADSEGIARELVIDLALGVGRTDDPEMLEVMMFKRFHALDGIDWTDAEAKARHYIGAAIRSFVELERTSNLKPIEQVPIPRVFGSAAMRMADHHYLAMPRSTAGEGTPLILNNACVSWHQLAGRFMFAGARAYVGTMIEVTAGEASAVITRMLEKYWGKPIAHAIWAAQRDVYGSSLRRPYVVSGVYPQRLRTTRRDALALIGDKLADGERIWRGKLAVAREAGVDTKRMAAVARWYAQEHAAFRKRWSRKDAGK